MARSKKKLINPVWYWTAVAVAVTVYVVDIALDYVKDEIR